jgi:hypothetical protein
MFSAYDWRFVGFRERWHVQEQRFHKHFLEAAIVFQDDAPRKFSAWSGIGHRIEAEPYQLAHCNPHPIFESKGDEVQIQKRREGPVPEKVCNERGRELRRPLFFMSQQSNLYEPIIEVGL